MLIIGVSTVSVGEADVTGQPDVFFAGAFPKTSKIQKHKHPQKLLGLAWFASQLWRTVYGKNIPKPEAVQPTQNIKNSWCSRPLVMGCQLLEVCGVSHVDIASSPVNLKEVPCRQIKAIRQQP